MSGTTRAAGFSAMSVVVALIVVSTVAGLLWMGAKGASSGRQVVASGAASPSSSPSAAIDLLQSVTPASEGVAGMIFGVPVGKGNYYFAKRVAYMFPRPWGAADVPEEQRDDIVWEQLILHYESFRRGVTVTDDELEEMVNILLKNQEQTFTRRGDPAVYQQWVTEALSEPVDLFENQVRYLIQIRNLRNLVLQEQQVTVTDEEMQQEFLNEQHHVGGEIVVFDAQAEAQAFYEQYHEPAQWEAKKAEGSQPVRPVSLMTLEAYMDLWSIPKDQIYAFHALELGSVGAPMPFGKAWCVYRLLDKRTGDLNDFPAQRDAYRQQVEMKKKYEALARWIEDLKQRANRQAFVDASSTPATAASE